MIHTRFGFDLQPTRILFLVGFFLILCLLFSKQKNGFSLVRYNPSLFYSIVLYTVFSSIVIALDSKHMLLAIPLISAQMVAVVVYIISSQVLSQKSRYYIDKVILTFALVSVLVSMFQFFVDSTFFRLSSERLAFDTYIRANGFLLDEFDNGLFLTIIAAYILFSPRGKIQKLVYTTILSIGIILTMHRGSWIIFSLTVLLYLIVAFMKENVIFGKSILFIGVVIAVIILFLVLIYPNTTKQSTLISRAFIEDQLLRNTLNIRERLVDFGIDTILKYPQGIGDYSFEKYKSLYVLYGLPLNNNKPLIIHNGYVGSFVKYGVLGGLLFIYFLITFLGVLLKNIKSTKNIGPYFYMSIYISFIILNLSQEISSFGSFSTIILFYFLGTTEKTNYVDIKK